MNVYVRPRCTSSTVDENREPRCPADTANTRRPVNTERLNWLPRLILPTVLPSIRKLTTVFLPRFGSIETIRRPVDAAAVPIETAYMRPRIRTILHMEMYFDFMASRYAWDAFLANAVLIDVRYDSPAEQRGNDSSITRFRPNERERAIQSKPKR